MLFQWLRGGFCCVHILLSPKLSPMR
jgi:hypothetical protein